MASIIPTFHGALRLSARAVTHGNSRMINCSARLRAAQNFTMPAMSPTMTEGNIASWKVKEGDSYSAGDVLLEIETDKAQMDVEAQDDGILAKIIQPDGSKAIKVGARIAICAEPGDDLSTLEIPEEEPAQKQESKKDQQSSSHTPASPPKEESKPGDTSTENTSGSSLMAESDEHGAKRSYPLYPSVIQLLHVNGISKSDATKITATGPGGRLLKGDVLAYMGSIEKSYPQQQSERLGKLAKLDLSNINVVSKDPAGGKASPPEQASAEQNTEGKYISEPTAEASIAISLSTVTEVQQRISKTLGIDVPLAEFIARAVAVCNTDLPAPMRAPTADELFYGVLGIEQPPLSPLGHFNPQILTQRPEPHSKPRRAAKSDIIDILTGAQQKTRPVSRSNMASASEGTAHVFSVEVPVGEEQRAKIFLQRLKTVLQVDPGRLVL